MAISSDGLALLFKIRADGEQARTETARTSREVITDVKKMEREVASFARERIQLQESGERAWLQTRTRLQQQSADNFLNILEKERTAQQASLSALNSRALAVGGLFTAAAGAGVAAWGAVFELSRRASDAGSKLYDLSRNTGVSTETLSGFKVAADQADSSIEAVGGGITKFTRLVSEAARGNEEATETLKRFGIDPQEALNDVEGALQKVLTRIGQLPEGAQRAAAAQMVFGRGGAELVSTLEAMGFSLEEARKKADELGQLFDTRAAKAADDFGDKLDDLQKKATGMGYTLGKDLLPEFAKLFDALTGSTDVLGKQTSAWDLLGKTIKGQLADLRAAVELIRAVAETGDPARGFALAAGRLAVANAKGVNDDVAGQVAGDAKRLEAPLRGLGAEMFAQTPEEMAKLEAKVKADAERLRALGERLLKEALRDEESARRERFEALQADLTQEMNLREEAQKRALAKLKQQEEEKTVTRQQAAQKRLSTEFYTEQLRREQADKLLQKGIDENLKPETIKALERRVELLKEEAKTHQTLANIALTNAAREDSIEAQAKKIKGLEAIADALERAAAASDRLSSGGPIGPQFPQSPVAVDAVDNLGRPLPPGNLLSKEELEGLGPDPEPTRTVWTSIKETVTGSLNEMSASIATWGDLTSSVFDSVASAVGDTVRSFVLLGESGGSVRKWAAEVIAGVAAMAAVKAVFEAAEAIAALARAVFGDPKAAVEAKLHGAAAVKYGLVAGAAALAGRAIAGNAFKDGGGGPSASGLQSAGFGGSAGGEQQARDSTFQYGGTGSPASQAAGEGSGSVSNNFFRRLRDTLDNLDRGISRMQSMPPGDVVTIGAPGAQRAIGVAVLNEQGSNYEFTDTFFSNAQFAR